MLITRDFSSPGWLRICLSPQEAVKLIKMNSWVVTAGLSVVGKDQQVPSRLFSEDMIYHSFKLAGRPSKLWEVMNGLIGRKCYPAAKREPRPFSI